MPSEFRSRVWVLIISALASTLPDRAVAGTVSYSGMLVDPVGTPGDDWLTVGTFAPGESPATIIRRYADSAGNFGPTIFTASVNAGYFRPIGGGTMATTSGLFSGSGEATGIDGLPIYLWAFERPTPQLSLYMAWCTGTDATWSVLNGGSTSINAATANTYVVGMRGTGGTVNLFVPPIPEPSLVALIAVPLGLGRRRRNDVGA